MDSVRKARVLKVVDPIHYYLLDLQTKNVVKVELYPRPDREGYLHILRQFADQEVTYELRKKTKMIEEYQKGTIFLKGTNLCELYKEPEEVEQCLEQRVYEKDQILECFILNIECLKLNLLILQEHKTITYYQSELRLSRIETMHPKEVWQKAQDYFKDLLLGSFVQIKINGSQTYREQLNIHGEILRLHDGHDIKEQFLRDGYAELSKNCEQYLTEHRIEALNKVVELSKQEKRGIWGQGNKIKATNNAVDHKYKQWEQWEKNRISFKDIKNGDLQIKQIANELKKNSGSKPDPTKCRILLQAVLSILEDSINEKTFPILQEFIKVVINAMVNLQTGLSLQIDSMDFLKYLNKLLIMLIFYVGESEKLGSKNTMGTELDKAVKVIFKSCFVGNETFHQKVFDKRKQSDFEKFSYDPASLSGISSFSEQSDYEEGDKLTKQVKLQKKHAAAQAKIRINATALLGLLFKNYSSIVQNHWEICVKSNNLTEDFLLFVQTLKITIDQEKMKPEEKKKLAALMRSNFGDQSLVMLVCFEQNSKVKANALNCMINMVGNFPDRRIIDTTEPSQVQKQLKTTKSSFVPKSFIIFSGLRNALYFLLFSLHHEKNIVIIVNTFKALTELCQQSTLVDKMGFIEGMGLLMANYINPVLQFPWNIPELNELKSLCISFLAALVGTQKKWEEMETQYLMSESNKNVNSCLINAMNQEGGLNEKIVIQILKYFTKLSKHYYSSIFYEIEPGQTVWLAATKSFMSKFSPHFGSFIQEIFKSHFDQLSFLKNNTFSPARATTEAIKHAQASFGPFLTAFLPVYGQVATIQNYISLINIITFISYDRWADPDYLIAKDFLNYCFKSIHQNPQNSQYPSVQHLKSNSIMRICLIKLLGYISFCPEFQNPTYSTQAVRSLLNFSKNYKSLNCVVKVTWGISNWAHIDCFTSGLTEIELKECLDYMVKNSQSQKQKIASNCTRGIGFILKHFKEYDEMEECISAIVKNLSHPILKVRTNSTKTLRSIFQKSTGIELKLKIKVQELVNLLQQNVLKNSYQLQTETLLLIKSLGHPIHPEQMLKLYSHILHDLQNHTTLEYQFSQIKALRQLRKVILEQITALPEQLSKNKQASSQLYQSILDFILDSKEESARKEAENSKILDRGFEIGEEALNAVFNIRKQQYDEQKTITTQFILRGLVYQAVQADIKLLNNIRDVAERLVQENEEWKQIAVMKIDGCQISIGMDLD